MLDETMEQHPHERHRPKNLIGEEESNESIKERKGITFFHGQLITHRLLQKHLLAGIHCSNGLVDRSCFVLRSTS